MRAAQLRFWPDPRPLVERFGAEFFRQVPTESGVYLLRDSSDQVLYVGKAKNLRSRLSQYRVANPDLLPRRRVRLLHLTRRIEWHICDSEAAALRRESELLRTLRPRFNRAGTWPGRPKWLSWQTKPDGCDVALGDARPDDGVTEWMFHIAAGGVWIRASLVRIVWCGVFPTRDPSEMPAGWFHSRLPARIGIGGMGADATQLALLSEAVASLFRGDPKRMGCWMGAVVASRSDSFAAEMLKDDEQRLSDWVSTIGSPGCASPAAEQASNPSAPTESKTCFLA